MRDTEDLLSGCSEGESGQWPGGRLEGPWAWLIMPRKQKDLERSWYFIEMPQ